MIRRNKKGAGLVTGLILGIGALVIMTIVALVIVDTLDSADLIPAATNTTSQEDATMKDDTGLVLTGCDGETDGTGVSIISIRNATGAENLTSGNYTISGCAIISTATSTFNETTVNISYSFNYDSESTESIDNMISNYTAGIDNVSSKLPTILLIVAVVLLFGAIVLLVARSRQMGGGGSEV